MTIPGSAVIGNLAVNLTLETAAFQNAATQMEKRTADLGKKLQGVGKGMMATGAVLSAGITAPFAALMAKAIPAARESREAMAQVEAGLKSMGGQSGKTAEELDKSAQALMRMSTFDDDDILRKVTANMLTFGNVAGQEFDRAQKAVVNMATRLNMDLQPATIMIGKALNDPVKGLTALGRAGVQFSADQKEMIKGMVAVGDIAGAQRIILAEIERQFGGSAQAMRAATPGIDTIQAWDSFKEKIGEVALNMLPPLTNFLTKILDLFNNLTPTQQAWAVGIAAAGAALGPLLVGLGGLVTVVGTFLPLLAALSTRMLALVVTSGPIGIAIVAVGALYLAFKNWDKIEPIVRAMVEAVAGALRRMGAMLVGDIRKAVEGVAGVIRGMKDNSIAAVRSMVEGMANAIRGMKDAVVGAVRAMVEGVANAIRGKLGAAFDWAKEKVRQFKDAVRDMAESVALKSDIPDMVEIVAQEMARLGQVMVDPAISATDKVAAAFQGLANIIGGLFGGKAGSIVSSIGNFVTALLPLFGGIFGGKPTPGAIPETGATGGYHPGWQHGVSGRFGGFGGVDKNVLSLNGSPIGRVSRGEHFQVSPANSNAPQDTLVRVVPSPYFDVQVQKISRQTVADTAPTIVAASQQVTMKRLQRRRIS